VVEFFTSRIEKLRSYLDKKQLHNILILSDENIFYLTGFYGKDSGSLLLITPASLYLLVHFNYFEQAKKSVKNKKINIVCYQKGRFKKLSEVLKGYNFKSIGIEGRSVSFTDYCNLKKILSRQGKKLINTDGLVEKLRVVKDEDEISKIKTACKITDKV